MKLSAIVVAALVSIVSAQQADPIISVTSPLAGTVYKAGGQAIITWINPKVETINGIMLAKGPSTALQPVTQVAQSVPGNALTYTWNIPADMTPGNDYAFEFGQSPNMAFTGHFTITAGTGNATTPATSSGAAGSSSAATKPTTPANGGSSPSPSSGTKSSTGASSTPSSGANALTGSAIAMGAAAIVAAAQLL